MYIAAFNFEPGVVRSYGDGAHAHFTPDERGGRAESSTDAAPIGADR